jgi:hypothetical protein
MFPGRFYDYLRPAARYAIQNAERAVRELRPSHNSELIDYNIRAICGREAAGSGLESGRELKNLFSIAPKLYPDLRRRRSAVPVSI